MWNGEWRKFKKFSCMGENTGKIRSFTDLIVWREGHTLVLEVYRATESFPRAEIFGLVNQLRRCAVSITSNIAEGFGRKSYKEKVQFYSISKGSVLELQNQLLISRDIGFLQKNIFDMISEQSITVSKLLTGIIRKSKDFS